MLTRQIWFVYVIGVIECFHMTSRRPYWCPKTMKRRPWWCPKPILWEINSFLMQTLSFVSINLRRCRPREWKHSITDRSNLLKKRVCYPQTLTKNWRTKQSNKKEDPRLWVSVKTLICTEAPDLVIVNLIFDQLVCIPFSAQADDLIFL